MEEFAIYAVKGFDMYGGDIRRADCPDYETAKKSALEILKDLSSDYFLCWDSIRQKYWLKSFDFRLRPNQLQAPTPRETVVMFFKGKALASNFVGVSGWDMHHDDEFVYCDDLNGAMDYYDGAQSNGKIDHSQNMGFVAWCSERGQYWHVRIPGAHMVREGKSVTNIFEGVCISDEKNLILKKIKGMEEFAIYAVKGFDMCGGDIRRADCPDYETAKKSALEILKDLSSDYFLAWDSIRQKYWLKSFDFRLRRNQLQAPIPKENLVMFFKGKALASNFVGVSGWDMHHDDEFVYSDDLNGAMEYYDGAQSNGKIDHSQNMGFVAWCSERGQYWHLRIPGAHMVREGKSVTNIFEGVCISDEK